MNFTWFRRTSYRSFCCLVCVCRAHERSGCSQSLSLCGTRARAEVRPRPSPLRRSDHVRRQSLTNTFAISSLTLVRPSPLAYRNHAHRAKPDCARQARYQRRTRRAVRRLKGRASTSRPTNELTATAKRYISKFPPLIPSWFMKAFRDSALVASRMS